MMMIKKFACALLVGAMLLVPAFAGEVKAAGQEKPVVTVTPYTGKALIRWTMPDYSKIRSYRVSVSDDAGNEIRTWNGIVKESNSVLLKELHPDFSFTVVVTALDMRESELYRSVLYFTSDSAKDSSELKYYDVTYSTSLGTLYGLTSEEVIFGQLTSKTPEIINVPDGCEFIGWSVDGETVVDLSEYRIYKDTEFKAIIAHVEA